ncbi:MAG: DUF1861 family protein [Acholeplasmataceae bacterium]|nr:DUF1861 family protein [Acholeplasmataceae bacterium]
MNNKTMPKKACDLVTEHRHRFDVFGAERIHFQGTKDDVYNISAPFDSLGKTYIAGRIEQRDREISAVGFFKEAQDTYTLDQSVPMIPLFQDPSVQIIDDQMIIGGTRIITDHDDPNRITGWHTSFYQGSDLMDLTRIGDAPSGMKDVRVIRVQDQIAVFTRPQGGLAGPGKIGFMMIDTLFELSPDRISKATILSDHFRDDEWGGANQLHVLNNGWIGVLGHISRRDQMNHLHYAAMTFAFHPWTMETRGLKVIAERRDFLEGEAKREDLHDVIFPGGLVRTDHGKALLYAGISDCEAQRLTITDPYLDYEQYEEVIR